jgi:hypothetical protein
MPQATPSTDAERPSARAVSEPHVDRNRGRTLTDTGSAAADARAFARQDPEDHTVDDGPALAAQQPGLHRDVDHGVVGTQMEAFAALSAVAVVAAVVAAAVIVPIAPWSSGPSPFMRKAGPNLAFRTSTPGSARSRFSRARSRLIWPPAAPPATSPSVVRVTPRMRARCKSKGIRWLRFLITHTRTDA